MTVEIGAQLGVYQITSLIGEGGMGRVYRAHDSRLKRDVAIKVLPDEFAADPERLARFIMKCSRAARRSTAKQSQTFLAQL